MKQTPPVKRRTPVRIEILSPAENTSLLHNDLNDILADASGCCGYTGYIDLDGSMRVQIECIVSDEEKQFTWDQMLLRHRADCYISAEPAPMEPVLIS
jgi:hypothetical protein